MHPDSSPCITHYNSFHVLFILHSQLTKGQACCEVPIACSLSHSTLPGQATHREANEEVRGLGTTWRAGGALGFRVPSDAGRVLRRRTLNLMQKPPPRHARKAVFTQHLRPVRSKLPTPEQKSTGV